VAGFDVVLWQPIKVAHPKLFALRHLQRSTIDKQADVARLSRGPPIRRAKKAVQLVNSSRFASIDTSSMRIHQTTVFFRAVSHSIAAHSSGWIKDSTSPCDSNSDTKDNVDANDGVSNQQLSLLTAARHVSWRLGRQRFRAPPVMWWRRSYAGTWMSTTVSWQHSRHVVAALLNNSLLQCFYVSVFVVLSFCIKYVTQWSCARQSAHFHYD